jgi:hypothetical protein
MGTRSNIAKKLPGGTFKVIYCHWDGYPSNNGKLLLDHYTDEKKLDALLALGDISNLAEEIGTKHNFDWRSKHLDRESVAFQRYDKMVNAYGRDRGEKDIAARIVATRDEVFQEEYAYVWEDGQWVFRGCDSAWAPLTQEACIAP